jgi:VCBS repeat-containing protein
VTGVTHTGPTGGLTDAQLQSYLTLTPTSLTADPGSSHNLTWNFNSGTQAFDFLASGQTLQLAYTLLGSDGHGSSVTQTVTINITGTNDAAVLSADIRNLTEANAAAAISASGTLTISDVDSAATFQAQTNTAGSYGHFSVGTDGAWTYTADSAHNEFVDGQLYTDTFQVLSADGTATSVTINILGTNDAPVLTNVAATAAYTENAAGTQLASGLLVGDVDNANLTSASVWISGGFLMGDVLAATTAGTNITAAYNSATGLLTLTGSDTLAHYQQVLRTVTFSSTSDNPTDVGGYPTRTVNWQVNDGSVSDISFQSHVDYAAGSAPRSVAIGDLNGDGKLDLVVPNFGSNDISIRLGNGDGTFGPTTNIAAGTSPISVAVCDLNGDGKLDLAVANHNSNNISVLLGNGNGTFAAATNLGTGTGPASVAVADFNGDGKLDFAVANYYSSDISVLLGNGNGTFAPATNFATGSGANSIAVGDFNGDGKLDLVTANYFTNNVSVLLGNGNGTFAAASNLTAGTHPYSVAIGDINEDGKLDLVVANTDTNNVSVLLGNGNGTFAAASNFAAGSGATSVAIGDLNGDGKLDIAVANNGSNNVSVLLGNGTGTFAGASNFAVGTGPWTAVIRDINGDGGLDLAVANVGSNNVSVLLNANTNLSAIQTTTINITAVNDGPVASGDSYSTNEDTTLTVSAAGGVLTNDTDVDGPSLSAILVNGPAHGSLALNADGSFIYTPTANYNGSDSFTYRANDGSLVSNIAAVNITVVPVNDPVVTGATTVRTEMNTVASGPLNAIDPDGDGLTFSILTGPTHGQLSIGTNGTFVYTPALGYFGGDSFTYHVQSADGSSADGTVSISVARNSFGPSKAVATSGNQEWFDTEFPGGDMVAPLSSGRFVATWRDSSLGVFARVFDADGNPTSAPILVNSAVDYSVVTGLPNGGFAVATAGLLKIYNSSLTQTQTLSTGLSAPSIASAPDGTIYLQNYGGGSLQRFQLVNGSYVLNATVGTNSDYAEVKVLTNGDVVVLNATGPNQFTIYHSTSGGLVPFATGSYSGSATYNDIAALDNGGFVIASNSGTTLLASIYDSSGTAVAQVNTGVMTNGGFSHVSALQGGGFVVSAVDSSETFTTVREFNNSGRALTNATTISTGSFFIDTNSMPGGGYVLAYSPNTSDVNAYVNYDAPRNYVGGSGSDVFVGGNLNDQLVGAGGNDWITGGSGGDTLTGGGGSDTFRYNAVTDSQPGTGNFDIITDFNSSYTIDFSGITTHVIYQIQGAVSGPSQINPNSIAWYADGQGNTVVITDASSTVHGQVDMQILLQGFTGAIGSGQIIPDSPPSGPDVTADVQPTTEHQVAASNDTSRDDTTTADDLTGGSSAGTLIASGIYGQPGTDLTFNVSGNQTITSGGGQDTFVVNAGFGNDTITDFDVSKDVIQFSPALFANYSAAMANTQQVGTNTVINYDANDTLTLNVTASSLIA